MSCPRSPGRSHHLGGQSPYAVAVSEPEGPPDLLYHYTGWEGLEGILRERMIWATDVRYLNDTSEVHYTREVIGQRAADREVELSETYGGFLAQGTAAGLGDSAMFLTLSWRRSARTATT